MPIHRPSRTEHANATRYTPERTNRGRAASVAVGAVESTSARGSATLLSPPLSPARSRPSPPAALRLPAHSPRANSPRTLVKNPRNPLSEHWVEVQLSPRSRQFGAEPASPNPCFVFFTTVHRCTNGEPLSAPGVCLTGGMACAGAAAERCAAGGGCCEPVVARAGGLPRGLQRRVAAQERCGLPGDGAGVGAGGGRHEGGPAE